MWILTLNGLWALPVAVFFWSHRHSPKRVWLYTGASFGLIVEPAAIVLYGLYFHPVTAVLGILGLLLTHLHGAPGYRLAITFGLLEPFTVVRGMQYVYTSALASLVWTPAYGAFGYLVDRVRQWRQAA